MIQSALLTARAGFYHRADAAVGCETFISYVRDQGLDILAVGWHVGVTAVVPVVPYPGDRFDFADDGEAGFVCEALGADGETVVDLIAWHLGTPARPLSMFGRCGVVGLWQALSPATFIMGGTLRLHRTPLSWLRSGCDGAAIVHSGVAGRQLLDVPGRIATEDQAHGREIATLLRSAADLDNKVVVPSRSRRAA